MARIEQIRLSDGRLPAVAFQQKVTDLNAQGFVHCPFMGILRGHRNPPELPVPAFRALSRALSLVLLSASFGASAKEASTDVPVGVTFVSEAVAPSFKQVDVRQLPAAPLWQPGDPIREIPKRFESPLDPTPRPVNPVLAGEDRLATLQRQFLGSRGPQGSGFDTPLLNFLSIGNTGVQPSDVNGDVGKDHFINSVNGGGGALIAIYDKLTGAQIGATFSLETLGSGGPCASGLGDAIILYDELAERWVLTEFVSGANDLCFYISDGSDPVTAVWTRYNFTMPSFPDYPKYGVWPDAYYGGANESGTGGQRPIYAFDRVAMLAGNPATFQRVTIPNLAGFGFQMIQPADHDGKLSPPPAGAPGIFMRHRDDESHNSGNNNPAEDYLELWELDVDFATPANTVLSPVQQIAIAEIDSNLNGLTAFQAFPQPSGQRLDPLRETVMHRLAYRNMGSHEALIGNLVTDVDGNDTGGVRWFELRRVGGPGNPWTLFQEGTYAPADAGGPADRWMGGIAMDESGNIALGYSITRQSPGIPPGLRYVGRLNGDPLGVMTTNENNIVDGGGSQGGQRWGDYHSMSVDPEDGCTFWFTGNFVPASSWATQAAAFKHDACGSPTFSQSGTNLEQSVCAGPVASALDPVTLTVNALNGFADPVDLDFGPNPLPTGFTGDILPMQVNPPGVATVQLNVDNTAALGENIIPVRGVSGAIERNTQVRVNVSTETPDAPMPSMPADMATGVATTVTFSWSASAQVENYRFELATDPGFTNVIIDEMANGTNFQPAAALGTNSTYYWRVSAANICGDSGPGQVFSFTTVPAPGDCATEAQTNVSYSYGFEAGASGWTSSGTGNTWAQSTQRVNSGTFSWKAVDPASTSDQRLVSPSIVLPTGESPLTLQFFHYRDIEESGATQCWDAGILEVSTNGGTTWTQVPSADLLSDPYNGTIRDSANPLQGLQGYCNLQDWTSSIVDIDDYAGQTVQFRFRMGSDASVGAEGWYIDDVKVQSCRDASYIFDDGFESASPVL